MKHKLNLKRIMAIVFLACCTKATPLQAQVAHFLSSDQFSSSLISEICQDHQGAIWIATDYGLNRFDGYSYQTFLHDEADSTSLLSNMTVSLFCDNQGQLWVGSSRGLDSFNAATATFTHHLFPDDNKPRVTEILQRLDGSMLVGTAGYGCCCTDTDILSAAGCGNKGHAHCKNRKLAGTVDDTD